MALVGYSSSSSSDSEPASASTLQGTKRKRQSDSPSKAKRKQPQNDLPALPSRFHDLYASSVRVSTQDDPDLHHGRQRQVPHVQGNWPSHVYIEWFPSRDEYEILTDVLHDATVKAGSSLQLHSSLKSDLGVPQPLHISLSSPLTLQTATRHAYAGELKQRLNALRLRPFEVSLGDVIWAANTTLDRFFLAIRTEKPKGDELNRLLKACNDTAEKEGQPALYLTESHLSEQPDASSHFHFSIAWSLKQPAMLDPKVSLVTLAPPSSSKCRKKVQQIKVQVDAVKIKIGNEQISLPLGIVEDSTGVAIL